MVACLHFELPSVIFQREDGETYYCRVYHRAIRCKKFSANGLNLEFIMSRQNTSFISRTQSFEKSRRFIQSVSDIYGKDEMEELLDEIRHLEPCNFQSDDIQDFEIDGSRHLHHTRGESTISVSVQSWDSHAVYRHKMDSMKAPVEAIQSILVHFRPSQCLEKLELFRLAFLVSSTIFKLCD